jgi:hypothetical protein
MTVAHTAPDLVHPEEFDSAIRRLRQDFPSASTSLLAAALSAARRDLLDVPPFWLAELSERLAWWRIATARGAR